MTATSFYQRLTDRRDVLTLLGGISFSLAFTALIAWAGGRLDAIELLPDQGDAWYYWKLPAPTNISWAIRSTSPSLPASPDLKVIPDRPATRDPRVIPGRPDLWDRVDLKECRDLRAP